MFAALNSFQVGGKPTLVSEVFSTSLYTGNGSTQTITNSIDLSTKGGLVWIKGRNNATNNLLFDTNRGVNNYLVSDTNSGQSNPGNSLSAFNTNGFTVQDLSNAINETGFTYVSWTFREQPKFFDIVTYTGNGVAGLRSFAHSLGSVPGFIIIKDCTNINPWIIYHRSITAGNNMEFSTGTTFANGYFSTAPTASVFSVDSTASTGTTNVNGATYVAYIFAHDAGGFVGGNAISCGSFTSDSAGLDVTLGYEPQWVMLKVTNSVGLGWYIWDTKRGFVVGTSGGKTLEANSSGAEADTNWISPTATGFKLNAGQVSTGNPFIYIAIKAS